MSIDVDMVDKVIPKNTMVEDSDVETIVLDNEDSQDEKESDEEMIESNPPNSSQAPTRVSNKTDSKEDNYVSEYESEERGTVTFFRGGEKIFVEKYENWDNNYPIYNFAVSRGEALSEREVDNLMKFFRTHYRHRSAETQCKRLCTIFGKIVGTGAVVVVLSSVTGNLTVYWCSKLVETQVYYRWGEEKWSIKQKIHNLSVPKSGPVSNPYGISSSSISKMSTRDKAKVAAKLLFNVITSSKKRVEENETVVLGPCYNYKFDLHPSKDYNSLDGIDYCIWMHELYKDNRRLYNIVCSWIKTNGRKGMNNMEVFADSEKSLLAVYYYNTKAVVCAAFVDGARKKFVKNSDRFENMHRACVFIPDGFDKKL